MMYDMCNYWQKCENDIRLKLKAKFYIFLATLAILAIFSDRFIYPFAFNVTF